jgi:hypothetical protein
VYALCGEMRRWTNENHGAQMDMCVELEQEFRVPDGVMLRVHARHFWYLHPSTIYPSLEAYINATRAALTADVRVYLAEIAAEEAARRKRRRTELKAQRAAEPTPARAHAPRVCKRTRAN